MNQPLIEVKHLSVHYDGRTVLNDLSFSVESGETVAVVGPNGSGKTTLLRVLLGLTPYRGSVLLRGKTSHDAFGKKVGYVPQRFDFDRTIPLTVGEFLELPFPRVTSRHVKRVLLEVGMKECEHRLISSLSGGQFQRILMARALVNDPLLLILDEATSSADIVGTKGFYDILSHLREVHRTTVILVSHEISMVYKFADRIICLNRDLICFGKPQEAITHEVLEKLYGKNVVFQDHKHSP